MTKKDIDNAWEQAYSIRKEDGHKKKELVDERIEGTRVYVLWGDGEGGYGYTVDIFKGTDRIPEEIAIFG